MILQEVAEFARKVGEDDAMIGTGGMCSILSQLQPGLAFDGFQGAELDVLAVVQRNRDGAWT